MVSIGSTPDSTPKKNRFGFAQLNPVTRLFISTVLLVGTLYVLAKPWGSLPPMGQFLSTFHGVWLRAPDPFTRSDERSLVLDGLKGRVEIVIDENQIKHVFAENDEDLYFAQGFVVASDRLWQMEFLSRLAAGRLSEIVGPATIEMDKFFIKSEIPEAAKESVNLMMSDELSAVALKAYAAGVNAFVRSLDPNRLPFEYRLLGHTPEEWTPYKTALIGKFMAFYLSGLSLDLPLTRSRWNLHRIEFDDLFPMIQPTSETVIPPKSVWAFDGPRLQVPAREFKPDLQALAPRTLIQPPAGNGSNNWAVSAAKSTTGYPILSNDVHLSLQFPALWHQIQLSNPSHNTMGVSLVGVPGVMLGFNDRVAWGVTNGYTDILDWYQLRFRDENQSEYLYQGEWRPVISRETEIKVKGQEPIKLVLRRTHFGPVVYDPTEEPARASIPRGLAMRWGALEPSNELRSFLLLNRGKSVRDCRKAIENFNSPDQNILCADVAGSIGIWHMGKYPIKAPGQGRLILDGTSIDDEWKGWIPRDHVPHAVNPRRGYLLSANQWPVNSTYPYYLGSGFMPPYRAMRIGELLRAKKRHSPEDIMDMQGDSLSIPARMTVPHLLSALKNDPELDEFMKSATETISKWDFKYEETSVGATIYHTWFQHFTKRLWSSHFPNDIDYLYPSLERTIALIMNEPRSKWFDDPETEKQEWLGDIARESLRNALSELKSLHGSKFANWQWGSHRPTRIQHLTRLAGLGREIKARGTDQAIFANTGKHGPAWKMVVALGPQSRAWGVLPGGQSGDPTNPYYDTDLENWTQNKLKPLEFMSSSSFEATDKFKKFTLLGSSEENKK